MNRVWYLTELEQGFLLEVHSEVNRGQLSQFIERHAVEDRKSTRLNSSHGYISYAVFCLKKKKNLTVPLPQLHGLALLVLIIPTTKSQFSPIISSHFTPH